MSISESIYVKNIADALDKFPRIYRLAILARNFGLPTSSLFVSSQHDIVIDGFPRSASSFANRAFMFANSASNLRVASHVHRSAQIVLAAHWKIPIILLIRNPRDAVISSLALTDQLGQVDFSKAPKERWVNHQTARYVRFYERTIPVLDKCLVAKFEEATEDFGFIMKKLNEKFLKEFNIFNHTEANVNFIFDANRKLQLAPSDLRDALKPEFRLIYDGSTNARFRKRAERVYSEIIERRQTRF